MSGPGVVWGPAGPGLAAFWTGPPTSCAQVTFWPRGGRLGALGPADPGGGSSGPWQPAAWTRVGASPSGARPSSAPPGRPGPTGSALPLAAGTATGPTSAHVDPDGSRPRHAQRGCSCAAPGRSGISSRLHRAPRLESQPGGGLQPRPRARPTTAPRRRAAGTRATRPSGPRAADAPAAFGGRHGPPVRLRRVHQGGGGRRRRAAVAQPSLRAGCFRVHPRPPHAADACPRLQRWARGHGRCVGTGVRPCRPMASLGRAAAPTQGGAAARPDGSRPHPLHPARWPRAPDVRLRFQRRAGGPEPVGCAGTRVRSRRPCGLGGRAARAHRGGGGRTDVPRLPQCHRRLEPVGCAGTRAAPVAQPARVRRGPPSCCVRRPVPPLRSASGGPSPVPGGTPSR